ncbi:restriction endonuclease subunit S [Mycoplasmopsis felis]|uniref:restriction endonuclease subunit S n=1 Tax=Mycoplasmopsis felis TaxID=33923 RepID=UPI002B002814|nr:restriction endonuclease subunit S [Mycoplasmopsis felis]WQQ04791.1 restriction endonuclease subunit S [Mycoplasmopsis felis]
MKKVLVPSVRFKGFDEEWKEERLEYIAKVTNGKSNTSDNNKWGQYNLYIRSEEIYKSNKYIFDVEGVITVGDGNIGKIFHYVNGKFDLHQRCYLIYEFQNIWPKYFYYYFSQNFYKRAILMSYTATVNSIRMNTITDMDIMFPKELIEQQKIGKLLDQISNLITIEQSKLNKLKQLKQTLLQKMFPEGNSKVPRIRFKGFEGEWEEKKLENIYSFASEGGTPDTNKDIYYKPGLFYFTKIEDMANKYIYNTKAKISELGLKNSSAWIIPKNNILFSNGATIGNVSINKVDLSTKQGIVGMIIKKKFNLEFIYYLLKSENFQSKVAEKITVGTIPTVAIFNLKKIELFLSKNIYEQQKIGDFFSKIDTLINLYNSKLNKLKQIKEGLLQKMFV